MRALLRALSSHTFALATAALVLSFALSLRGFATPTNLLTILENSAVLLIVAVAATLMLAAGMIDLSLSVAVDLGAAFAVVALRDLGLPWPVAVLAALSGGALVGGFNSLLIVGLGLRPFLATFATLFIGSSLQRIATEGGGPIAFRRMPDEFRDLATGSVGPLPTEVLIAGVLVAGAWVFLERTVHGQRLRAIGLQPRAAHVAGIATGRYLVFVLVAGSSIAALGGVILLAGLRQYTPLAGQSYLLPALAAVFVGAALGRRRVATAPGTLAGALFLGVVANGLNLTALNFTAKAAAAGAILVLALALTGLNGRTDAGR